MKKLIFVLTLVAVANFACGSNLNTQGEQPVAVPTPIKIQGKLPAREYNTLEMNFQRAITKGYDLTVHSKGTHAEGNFIIFTKDDFANKDIEKAIGIIALEQHGAVASSQKEKYNVAIEDRISYYKCKKSTDKPEKNRFVPLVY
jgi:hypothetical protein